MGQDQVIRQTPESPPDISQVIDLALAYNPSLAMADLSTIRMWVNEGCSIDDDILPTLKEIMKRKPGITAFKYFTNPVLASRDKRVITAKQSALQAEKPKEYYIDIYRWKRAKGMTLTTEQEQMLHEYEANENPRSELTGGGSLVCNDAPGETLR